MSDDAPLPKDGDVQFASTAASAVASWMPVSGADDKDADAPVQRIAPRTGLGATRGRAKPKQQAALLQRMRSDKLRKERQEISDDSSSDSASDSEEELISRASAFRPKKRVTLVDKMLTAEAAAKASNAATAAKKKKKKKNKKNKNKNKATNNAQNEHKNSGSSSGTATIAPSPVSTKDATKTVASATSAPAPKKGPAVGKSGNSGSSDGKGGSSFKRRRQDAAVAAGTDAGGPRATKKRRKRPKKRSRQKNIRKDNRPIEKRPPHIQALMRTERERQSLASKKQQ